MIVLRSLSLSLSLEGLVRLAYKVLLVLFFLFCMKLTGSAHIFSIENDQYAEDQVTSRVSIKFCGITFMPIETASISKIARFVLVLT